MGASRNFGLGNGGGAGRERSARQVEGGGRLKELKGGKLKALRAGKAVKCEVGAVGLGREMSRGGGAAVRAAGTVTARWSWGRGRGVRRERGSSDRTTGGSAEAAVGLVSGVL